MQKRSAQAYTTILPEQLNENDRRFRKKYLQLHSILVSQWGYPDEEREFRGKKLYMWNYSKAAYVPRTSNTTATAYGKTVYAQTQSSGGYALRGDCVRILEVDEVGTVTSWQWKGNNCPFREAMEYSNWRRKSAK
jgi:hypothetical protein